MSKNAGRSRRPEPIIIIPGGEQSPTTKVQYDEHDIELDTKARNHISNFQCPDALSLYELDVVRKLEQRYKSMIRKRSDATALYNCHGMSFACRRTRIFDNKVVKLILQDDNYLEVPKGKVLEGDVVLYFDLSGDIEHSGIVVGLPDDFGMPLVVSKWGNGPEYVHRLNQCEYNCANVKYFRNRQ